jgi:predicted permease
MKPNAAISTGISVAGSVIVATGLLTITLGVIGFVNGTPFIEYYEYVFPRFRGGAPQVHIPALGYLAFVMYIGVAAVLAVLARRRIEAWQRRHTQ